MSISNPLWIDLPSQKDDAHTNENNGVVINSMWADSYVGNDIEINIDNQIRILDKSHSNGNSKWTTVFLMLNTMIGSGILNQPQVFSLSGIFGALILFAFAGYFIWLGTVVLVLSGVHVKQMSYQELMYFNFGDRGKWWLDFLIVIGNIGALMSYLELVGGTSTYLLLAADCSPNFANIYLITFLTTTFIVLPLCLNRFYGHLGAISYVSITCITVVLCLVVFYGPFISTNGPINAAPNMLGMFSKLGSIVFALSCSQATFHAYSSTKDVTPRLWKEIMTYSCLSGIALCISMGLIGYLDFKSATEGEILDNFSGAVAAPFNVLLVIHITLYIPVDFVVTRFSLIKLLQHGKEERELNLTMHVLVSVVLLYFCMLLVLSLNALGLTKGQAFGLILDLAGGIAFSAISFVFPALLYLKSFKEQPDAEYHVHCRAMFYFGCLTCILVVVSSFYNAAK